MAGATMKKLFLIATALVAFVIPAVAQPADISDKFATKLFLRIAASECSQSHKLISPAELEAALIAWTYVPEESKKRVKVLISTVIDGMGGFDKFCDTALRLAAE
jgi:hypothetical protein